MGEHIRVVGLAYLAHYYWWTKERFLTCPLHIFRAFFFTSIGEHELKQGEHAFFHFLVFWCDRSRRALPYVLEAIVKVFCPLPLLCSPHLIQILCVLWWEELNGGSFLFSNSNCHTQIYKVKKKHAFSVKWKDDSKRTNESIWKSSSKL